MNQQCTSVFCFSLITFTSILSNAGAQTLTSTVQGLPTGQPVQATSADVFVDSLGVATHWSSATYQPYTQRLETMLLNSGIRHIRDGVAPSVMRTLAPFGVKETVVIDPVGGIVPNLSYWSGAAPASTYAVADYIKTYMPANSVDALEMPNELDIFYYLYKWHSGDAAGLSTDPSSPLYYGAYGQAVTQDCWQIIKSDPTLANIRVIGPTVGVQVPSPYPAGSLFSYVDYGGLHSYPGRTNTWTYPEPYDSIVKYYWNSFEPSGNIGVDAYGGNPLMFTWYQPPFTSNSSAKQMVVTETGYQTGALASGSISALAQAKYTPRLYAEYFRNGIPHTFIYELFDEGTDASNQEQNFGLIYNNLAPKPAFTAVSTLVRLLSEPNVTFTPSSLSYSLSVQPNGAYTRTGYVHDLLLQKSNGDFYLLLWHEISDSSNTDLNGNLLPAVQRDITPPALQTTLSLPSNINSAVLYTYDSNFAFHAQRLSLVNNQVTLPATDTISVLKLSTSEIAAAGIIPNGVYTLTNAASQLVMDDPQSSATAGTQIIQWNLNSNANQQWITRLTGFGYYTFQNEASQLYLTAGGLGNASPLVQQSPTDSDLQLWSIQATTSGYLIVNKGTGMAIDDPGSNMSTGTGLILWPKDGGVNQSWLIH